jgi:hypothetical protein
MHTYQIPGLLYKYLILKGRICIPNFGCLQLGYVSAINNFANKKLYPPKTTIQFNSTEENITPNLVGYLAEQANLSEENTIELLNEFSVQLKVKIDSEEKVDWTGLGTITSLDNGTFSFQSKLPSNLFFDEIPYKHIIREKISHAVKVGEDERTNTDMETYFIDQKNKSNLKTWKTAALALLILSVMFIFFRFTMGNFNFLDPRQNPIHTAYPSPTYKLL